MKKVLVLATAAFLVTGFTFAQDKDKKKDAKTEKACCKDGKECKKDEKKEVKSTAKETKAAVKTATKKA